MTKNFFYTVLLSIINILFPVLSFPYASHILGPVGIGKVQLAISFAQYFSLFAALGIPIYGIRETARHKDDPKKLAATFTELTIICFIASLILFAVYLLIIYTIPFFSPNRTLFLSAGILVLLSFSYTDWFFSGIEAFRGITIRSVIIKSISLVFLYTFIKTEADFSKYLFIIVFSILGNQLLSFAVAFKKTRFTFSGLGFRKHTLPMVYLFSSTIAASIYTILDTVLLGFLSNNKAVGLYTAAVKLIKLTIPIVTSMGVILMPAISKRFAENNMQAITSLLDQSFNFLVFMAIPMGFGLALLAPELIVIFSGKQFISATSSMVILSSLPILIGMGHFFCFQILVPAGKNREVFFSILAGVFTCLLLNFLLVPMLDEVGASIANVITELVVTFAYLYFIRKHYRFRHNWIFVLQSVAISALFIPIVLLTRHLNSNPILVMAISIIVCCVIYACIQLYILKNTFLINFIAPIRNKLLQRKAIDNE